jgi:hypothetical protein
MGLKGTVNAFLMGTIHELTAMALRNTGRWGALKTVGTKQALWALIMGAYGTVGTNGAWALISWAPGLRWALSMGTHKHCGNNNTVGTIHGH